MRRLLTALGLTAATMASAENGTYGKYESPQYDVIGTVGAAEIRDYETHILAEVSVRGDQQSALNQGFRALAGYIFGGNDGGASVAMTSPVTQTSDGDIWTVTFMMPLAYTMDTLPKPNNDAVRFIQVPSQRKAVLEFSGRATTVTLDGRTQQLRDILARADLTPTGTAEFMFYDDPFTLPWARRNEVAIALQ